MSKQTLDFVMDTFDMSCDQCDTMFQSFPDAKRHYLREHSEPKGYIKCCGKKMRSLTTIEEHIQGHKNPESLKYGAITMSKQINDFQSFLTNAFYRLLLDVQFVTSYSQSKKTSKRMFDDTVCLQHVKYVVGKIF